MPPKRTPEHDREFEAAVSSFESAQRLMTVASKIGGVERLPDHLRADLCNVLQLPAPRTKARPVFRLVVDNTRPTPQEPA